jgi:hypothetical protein
MQPDAGENELGHEQLLREYSAAVRCKETLFADGPPAANRQTRSRGRGAPASLAVVLLTSAGRNAFARSEPSAGIMPASPLGMAVIAGLSGMALGKTLAVRTPTSLGGIHRCVFAEIGRRVRIR